MSGLAAVGLRTLVGTMRTPRVKPQVIHSLGPGMSVDFSATLRLCSIPRGPAEKWSGGTGFATMHQPRLFR